MPTDGDAAPVPGAVPGGRAESHEFSTLTGERADPEALGWSRGGLSTKIHLLAPYRQRNVVERAAKKLRGTRAVATRYDKARLRLLRHRRRRRNQDLATRPTQPDIRDTAQRGFAPSRRGVWRWCGGARRLRSAGSGKDLWFSWCPAPGVVGLPADPRIGDLS